MTLRIGILTCSDRCSRGNDPTFPVRHWRILVRAQGWQVAQTGDRTG